MACTSAGQRRPILLTCPSTPRRLYGHYYPETINPYIAQQVFLVLTPGEWRKGTPRLGP